MHYLMRHLSAVFIIGISLYSPIFTAQNLDSCIAVELQKCKNFLIQEEAQNMNALKKELSVPDFIWNTATAVVEKAKIELWSSLKKPLASPVRDKKIPNFIIAWLEEIAILYGIHPKSFHIKLMQVSGKLHSKKESFSSAYVAYPSYSIVMADKKPVSVLFHSDFAIYLHPKFIENFENIRVKTLYHEMMHIRTLNGMLSHLFFGVLKALGYDAQKTVQGRFIQIKATKLLERNTDLFVMLEGKSLAHCFSSFYEKTSKKLPSVLADYGDVAHFGKTLMKDWSSVICSLYQGAFFESNIAREKVALLQQRQNAAYIKGRSI